jgi:hypothetical protein
MFDREKAERDCKLSEAVEEHFLNADYCAAFWLKPALEEIDRLVAKDAEIEKWKRRALFEQKDKQIERSELCADLDTKIEKIRELESKLTQAKEALIKERTDYLLNHGHYGNPGREAKDQLAQEYLDLFKED